MQMSEKEIETFYPSSKQEWRKWLSDNHVKKQSVWLMYYRKGANVPTISWSEAVDEALCFGWIDSKKKTIDDQRYIQFFSRRKAVSTWSKVNKDKIVQLVENGSMTDAGLEIIRIAKENGSWTILDEVEALIVPKELEMEFQNHPGSSEFFESLSKSAKKILLSWVVLAKRPETKQKRIAEIAENASQNLKPKQFR